MIDALELLHIKNFMYREVPHITLIFLESFSYIYSLRTNSPKVMRT